MRQEKKVQGDLLAEVVADVAHGHDRVGQPLVLQARQLRRRVQGKRRDEGVPRDEALQIKAGAAVLPIGFHDGLDEPKAIDRSEDGIRRAVALVDRIRLPRGLLRVGALLRVGSVNKLVELVGRLLSKVLDLRIELQDPPPRRRGRFRPPSSGVVGRRSGPNAAAGRSAAAGSAASPTAAAADVQLQILSPRIPSPAAELVPGAPADAPLDFDAVEGQPVLGPRGLLLEARGAGADLDEDQGAIEAPKKLRLEARGVEPLDDAPQRVLVEDVGLLVALLEEVGVAEAQGQALVGQAPPPPPRRLQGRRGVLVLPPHGEDKAPVPTPVLPAVEVRKGRVPPPVLRPRTHLRPRDLHHQPQRHAGVQQRHQVRHHLPHQ
mmetsp:Transcript_277/g.1019  ORF Transcript_277/g.1019 Transcript_277/m.1019 type:complete len:377 (+) Transcript_277:2288-3418(+)